MFDNALRSDARALLVELNSGLTETGFYLAGGSGLALQLGHRVSEDLDFFTPNDFDPSALARRLGSGRDYHEVMLSPGTLYCTIAAVKLSFIRDAVRLVFPLIGYGSVQVADWRDIAAGKFETLAARGSRKDFYDIYACLHLDNLSIADAVGLFRRRFLGTGASPYHVLKSLGYFEDADQEPELSLLKPVPWSDVRHFFASNLKEFERYLLQPD